MDYGAESSWVLIGPLATAIAVACLAYLALRTAARLTRTALIACSSARRRRVTVLTFALLCASSGAPAEAARPLPVRGRTGSEPPWSGSSGSPPPLPLVPTEGAPSDGAPGAGHPALHGRPKTDGPRFAALFPRARPAGSAARRGPHPQPTHSGPQAERAQKQRSKSAQQTRPGDCCPRRHVVRAGDALWGIAAEALATDDPRRIARYWPAIHRANRSVIGSNPDLIRPGQILSLPEESGP
jgi:resuscitation-promoting factor RpfA